MKPKFSTAIRGKGVKLCLGGWAVTALLGLKHLGDVNSGAVESGDMWLLSGYGILAVCVLAFVLGAGYLICLKKEWNITRAFVFCSLILGMLYLCVLPPLSAPDEVSHYISAYKLSNQLMGKTATEEHGLVYIRKEDAFIEDVKGELDRVMAGDQTELEILGQTLTEDTYRTIYEEGLWGESEEGIVVSNQWTVRTTPLAYVPQAIGITLARLFSMSGVGLLFMGRFTNLLFYVGMTWLAMRRLPFGKEVLFGIALLPMTLHLTGSMSYDAMILGLSFYFTAHCLYLAYQADKVRPVDILILSAVMAVLAPCKIVYGVLMGLCLLIPVRKFGGWKWYLLSAFAVFSAFTVSMVLVNSQTIAAYATETNSYVGWAEEAGYSFSQVISNPGIIIKMFYNTIVWQAEYYHLTMLGAYLGNIDLVLDVPYLVIAGLTVGLFGLAFRKPGDQLTITRGQKWWIWFLCMACFGATLFSMLIAWTPVSSNVINGVQGRYFLPILLILLLTAKNNLIVLTKNADRTILYLMCCANGYVLLRLFSVVSMRL